MCNCKGTTKGIANKSKERWLAMEIYDLYKIEIGDTKIQYFTKEQRELVLSWYEWVYPNSIPVDYKKANTELNKIFDYHNLR